MVRQVELSALMRPNYVHTCQAHCVCVHVCVSLQAPVAAVVLFGLGSVISVLYGVFTFRDCPEEAEALRKVVPC